MKKCYKKCNRKVTWKEFWLTFILHLSSVAHKERKIILPLDASHTLTSESMHFDWPNETRILTKLSVETSTKRAQGSVKIWESLQNNSRNSKEEILFRDKKIHFTFQSLLRWSFSKTSLWSLQQEVKATFFPLHLP